MLELVELGVVSADQGDHEGAPSSRDLDRGEEADATERGVEGEGSVHSRGAGLAAGVDDGGDLAEDRRDGCCCPPCAQGGEVEPQRLAETEQNLARRRMEGPSTDGRRSPALRKRLREPQDPSDGGHQAWLRRVAVTS